MSGKQKKAEETKAVDDAAKTFETEAAAAAKEVEAAEAKEAEETAAKVVEDAKAIEDATLAEEAAAAKEKADAELLATDAKAAADALKTDLKVERTKVTNLTKEKEAMSAELDQMKAAISARNESDLAPLTDEEKAMVTDFAGSDDDPIAVSKAITKLRKHKLIGAAPPPKADRSRVGGNNGINDEPDSWAEADRRAGLSTGR